MVTPELLRETRLVSTKQKIKVLARGELTVALTVKAHKFSAKAARHRRGRWVGRDALGAAWDIASTPSSRPLAVPDGAGG